MKIQSASLDVPAICPNKCRFCISDLYDINEIYPNVFDFKNGDMVWLEKQFRDRLEYLRQLGVDTLVLTGSSSEPIYNEEYLKFFNRINHSLSSRFIKIEIQTSGVGLDEKKFQFLDSIGVKTISLSLSSLDDKRNCEIERIPENLKFEISELCQKIKDFGFNLRFSLNINSIGFEEYLITENYLGKRYQKEFKNMDDQHLIYPGVVKLFEDLDILGPDQITFRKLYNIGDNQEIKIWIDEFGVVSGDSSVWWDRLRSFLSDYGRIINELPFGYAIYSIYGMSVVADTDCMSKENFKDIKYMILRRNCKIYTEWDDPASLIF